MLVGIVGVSGVFLLAKHSWLLGILFVTLATLGLIASHRHFDPADDSDSVDTREALSLPRYSLRRSLVA